MGHNYIYAVSCVTSIINSKCINYPVRSDRWWSSEWPPDEDAVRH